MRQSFDEEKGPHLVFADGTQSIYLADMSGDGLTDLVRIRNGEVCYWPNLGYGRFGAKVTMDNAPWFDRPDLFDQQRIRLADIDGSGTTDSSTSAATGSISTSTSAGTRWDCTRVPDQLPQRSTTWRRSWPSTCWATAPPAWSGPPPCRRRRAGRSATST